MRAALAALAAFAALQAGTLLPGQSPSPAPKTVPEASEHQRTSTHADVLRFLEALPALPHGDRLHRSVAGRSHEGRELLVVKAALPGGGQARVRVLAIGAIHAGEIEGKEALQMLLREIALGGHEELLAACELHFLPVYNADGNDRIEVRNRVAQNGPAGGVGQRSNAQGLDLNRDFVKAEAPETRSLLRLVAAVDPHLFLDLHTTNGSHHGYQLTYAPSLGPNVDPEVGALGRHLLEDVRAALAAGTPAFRTFDYGNLETRDGVRGWWTYDHRARYGVNWFGLRNRIGILGEAYSYCDFRTRIAATRAFVLSVLSWAAAHRTEVLACCRSADDRLREPAGAPPFLSDTTFGAPETLEVLLGEVDRIELEGGLGTRLSARDVAHPERMPVVRRFRARAARPLPLAWALPDPPALVVEALALHGIAAERLAAGRRVTAEAFAVEARRKPKRPFQGHQELQLGGRWLEGSAVELPAGTLWVDARQPLGRLAATLLSPDSEDSLSTWNYLEQQTGERYPVLAVVARDQ